MPENEKFYIVDGKKVPLKRISSVRLVTPERDFHVVSVAARLARSSRLAINNDVPSNYLVVRGDPNKLKIIKSYRDIKYTRSAFMDPDGNELILTDEVLIKFEDTLDDNARHDLVKKYNCEIIDDTNDIWRIRVLDLDDDAPLDTANKLAEENGVEYAEPNALQRPRFTSVQPPSEPRFADQWHLHNTGQGGGTVGADVNALRAWQYGYGSSEIRVVVHDSGVDITHPDLQDNIGPGWDFDNDDNNASNENGPHGTACAGIIAACLNQEGVVGIAPNCKIIPLRAAGAHTFITWAKTFEWAAQHGDIVSCSWTISPNNTLSRAIRDVINNGRNGKGTPVFCATGNDYDNQIKYPASMAETIAIGASTNIDRRSEYSNYGEGIDFVAPSSGGSRRIETTDIQSSFGYNTNAGTVGDYCEAENHTGFGGTSAATPLVAGVAALMLSVNPNLTAKDIRDILRETAVKIDSDNVTYDEEGWNNEYGYGRIDAYLAVKAASTPAYTLSIGATPSSGEVGDKIKFIGILSLESVGPVQGVTVNLMLDGVGEIGHATTGFNGEYSIEWEADRTGTLKFHAVQPSFSISSEYIHISIST